VLPYIRKLTAEDEVQGPPNAVMGLNRRSDERSGGEGEGARWIELIAMVYKNTLDNQDQRGSAQVVSTILVLGGLRAWVQ
jgi:hypothetical protein